MDLIHGIYLYKIKSRRRKDCSEASNGFIRMDMVISESDGSKVVRPCLHSDIHYIEKKHLMDFTAMDDFFQGNELIEKVGLDLFSWDKGKGTVIINEDVKYECEIKMPHKYSEGNVVILTNIQKTDHGNNMGIEVMLVICLLMKLKNRIGWIVIPLDLDFDISNINRDLMTRAMRFIECQTPGGNYLVWTNHDLEKVYDLNKLTMDNYIRKHYVDVKKA